jgi:hypothetical protein
MDDQAFLEDMQRITTRMNQVHLAKTLVKKGMYPDALRILQNVREKYTEPSMLRMIDFLIKDVQSRASSGPLVPPAQEIKPPS